MTTQSTPGNVTNTNTPQTTAEETPPPSPSNDVSPPPPVVLQPPKQAPPPDPPPSTPPPAPPAPPPIPASPPPSQPSPQKPFPPPLTPPVIPNPNPPSSSPPPTPVTPATPNTPEPPPSSSPPPPPTTPASFPPPPPDTSTPSPTPPTPAFPDTPTTPLPSLSPPPPPPASITQPPPPSAGLSPPSNSTSSNSSTIVIAAICSLVAALVIVGALFVCCWKKRRRIGGRGTGVYPPAMIPRHQRGMATDAIPSGNIPSDLSGYDSHPHAYPGVGFNVSKNTFTFEQLSQATEGFSDANLLGQGGFGYVHKGVLPNGEEVAIKQLKTGSGQGEREFHAEVEIISRVHHKHLVSLVGYCITGSRRLLVYEFLPNDTLLYHLHGQGVPVMDWPTRLRIAVGSARGLAYLHEDCYPKIIHRDIKAANILLDFRFEAKVADFGLAKFCSDVNTHVSTRVMGTFGYLAPEYASTGKLTEKSDVYSFGVVLLELITGRKPVNLTNSLVDWARPHLMQAIEDKNFDAIVDPQLQDSYNRDEMFRMVACAAMSVSYSARHRPRMSQIVRALEGNMHIAELMEEIKAAGPSIDGSQGSLSSEYNTGQYQNDLSEFRRMAFASQAYQSS